VLENFHRCQVREEKSKRKGLYNLSGGRRGIRITAEESQRQGRVGRSGGKLTVSVKAFWFAIRHCGSLHTRNVGSWRTTPIWQAFGWANRTKSGGLWKNLSAGR